MALRVAFAETSEVFSDPPVDDNDEDEDHAGDAEETDGDGVTDTEPSAYDASSVGGDSSIYDGPGEGREKRKKGDPKSVPSVEGRVTFNLWELLSEALTHTPVFHYDPKPPVEEGSEKDEDEDIGLRSVCMDSINVKQVSSGFEHAAFISTNNTLYIWGDNSRYALGFDSRGVAETRPGYVATSINMTNNAASTSALPGFGKMSKAFEGGPPLIYARPMPFFTESNVTLVACGDGFTLCVVDLKNFFSWGENSHGQLGFDDTRHRANPSTCPALRGQYFRQLCAGRHHCAAITGKDGDAVMMWGACNKGQLGHNIVAPRISPKVLKSSQFTNDKIKKVVCGTEHTIALTAAGKVYSWGGNAHGVLGLGNEKDSHKPAEITAFATGEAYNESGRSQPVVIADVAASTISMALDTDGNVYSWGDHLTLSHPTAEERARKIPLRVEWLQKRVQAISCGKDHMAAIAVDGELFAWGDPSASLLENAAKTIATANSKAQLTQQTGWLATAVTVELPEDMSAARLSTNGAQTILVTQPMPYFPSGEILSRACDGHKQAMGALFEWWGGYTQTGSTHRGHHSIDRTGWNLLGRALGLLDNHYSYTEWQSYFDEERVLTHTTEVTTTEKNLMDTDTFLKVISDARMKALQQLMEEKRNALRAPPSRIKKKPLSKRPWGAPPPPPKVQLQKRQRNAKERQANAKEAQSHLLHVWTPSAVNATRALIKDCLPKLRARCTERHVREVFRDTLSQRVLGFFQGPTIELLMRLFVHLALGKSMQDTAETTPEELMDMIRARKNTVVSMEKFSEWALSVGLLASDMPGQQAVSLVGNAWGAEWRERAGGMNFPEMMETMATCALTGVFPHSIRAMMAFREGIPQDVIARSVSIEQKMGPLLTKIQRWQRMIDDPESEATRRLDDEEIEEAQAGVYGAFCTTKLDPVTGELHVFTDRMAFRKARVLDNRLTVTYVDLLFKELTKKQAAAEASDKKKKSGRDRHREPDRRNSKSGRDKKKKEEKVEGASEPGMNYAVFRQAMGMMAVIKYPELEASEAFRFLVEEKMLAMPREGVDAVDLETYHPYMDNLLEEEVTEVFIKYQISLQRLFRAYSGLDSELGYTNRLVTWELLERVDSKLTIQDLLMLVQDKRIVPRLMSLEDLEEVLDITKVGEFINYSEFLDILGVLALYLYKGDTSVANADKVVELMKHCKLTEHDNTKGAIADPYAKWWDMKLESEADGAWYWGSTDEYPPSLVRDVVKAPKAPPVVDGLLKIATELTMQGKTEQALHKYHEARDEWLYLCETGLTCSGCLYPNQTLYFASAIGSVLEMAGNEVEALILYRSVLSDSEKLEEGHPDSAIVHNCLGAVYYHQQDYQMAFRAFVFTMVLRETSPILGDRHPDTAAAYNNLGCCLERLGKTGQAVYFMKKAYNVLQSVLGSDHPRTSTVSRNIRHTQCKSLQLKVPEKLSNQLKANFKKQGIQTESSEEMMSTWKEYKGLMYGEGRVSRLEEQNQKLIKFFFQPVGLPVEDPEGKKEEEKKKKMQFGRDPTKNQKKEEEQVVFDPKKAKHNLIINMKRENLNLALF